MINLSLVLYLLSIMSKIIKVCGVDYGFKQFDGESVIIILPVKEVDSDVENEYDIDRDKLYTKIHKDGWIISAYIQADYLIWIEEFTAEHKYYGIIKGTCDDKIECESEEAFQHFIKYHPFQEIDLGDI